MSGRCETQGNGGVALCQSFACCRQGTLGPQGQVQSIRTCTACWMLLRALGFILYEGNGSKLLADISGSCLKSNFQSHSLFFIMSSISFHIQSLHTEINILLYKIWKAKEAKNPPWLPTLFYILHVSMLHVADGDGSSEGFCVRSHLIFFT